MDLKITFVLALLVLAQATERTPLSIISVSSDPATVTNPIYSSLRGGKMIYIKAQGHSPDPTNNLVYVGTIQCKVPADGVTDTFISCVTGDTGAYSNLNNQPVTLISYGTAVSTSYPNTVYYQAGSTPQLRFVFPSAGFAGSTINLYGKHEISDLGDGLRDMGDVLKISLGEDLCSRFDVDQEAINQNGDEYVRCIESRTQEAGKYNVTEHVMPGFSNNSRYLRRTSLDPNEYFQFTALPTVNSISPSSGNLGGQYLTIVGTGFSNEPTNNTVTVDGNDCKVTSSFNEEIQCTLAPKNNGVSSLLSTNSSSQVNGYFSGAGLNYARYTYSSSINSIAKFVAAVRGADTAALGTPNEVGHRADMREANVYTENEAQTWNGYFTAPKTGTYTFRVIADDLSAVYIQTTYGSAEAPTTPLLQTSGHQYLFQPFRTNPSGHEATVDLEAGKSYYMEAYHLNVASTGFFNLAVEVPNTDNTTSFQVYQVDNVTTSSTVQDEIKNFSMTGTGLSGTIELAVVRVVNFKTVYEHRANVSYGCTAAQFKSALEGFDGYKNKVITVVRTIYDANGSVLPDTTGAARIDYVVNIYLLRSTSLQSETFSTTNYDGYTGGFLEEQTQTHSPLITGNWSLTIGGVAVTISGDPNIPYDISANNLQSAIRASVVEFDKVEVSMSVHYSAGYKATWMIKYRGFNSAVSSITVTSVSLSGGSGSPQIEANTRRAYSTNLEFDPIDYRFLNTASANTNVLVTTNGVPSVCTGTCSYSFHGYTEVTSLSYTGSTLSFGLSDPTSLGFAPNTVSVTVGDQPCTVSGTDITTLTCAMATNTDSTPILVAGSVTPIVAVQNYGIAGLASGVSALSVPLTVTSLSMTTGGDNGGYLINLNGAGFPLSKSLINIEICSKNVTIQSVNNIQATFFVPKCGSHGAQTVTVYVGALTDTSLSFSYTNGSLTAPTITSLVPTSANPGLKGALEIHGDKFGTNLADAKVYLSNATGKIYQLKVLQINDTYIRAGLAGGLEGAYTVEVNLLTNGDSIAVNSSDLFTYSFSVSSISPQTGSINGGTLLTITGENFATGPQETLVYVGFTLNWLCTIENITTTQIQCRTPAISDKYTVGSAVQVVVSTRLLLLNKCTGSCSFTYLDTANSPALSAISHSSASAKGSNTKAITLTGTALIDSNSFADVGLKHSITKTTTAVAATSSSATSVVFDLVSSIISASYQVSVRNAIGGTNAKTLAVEWAVGTQSWSSSGASTAGGIISLTNGGGYPASIDGVSFSIAITSEGLPIPVNIVSCCASNTVNILIPAAADGTAFTITFKGPVNTVTKTYTAATASTPTASLTSAASVSGGSNTIVFSATNAVAATISSIKLVSTIDSTQSIDIPANTWAVSGSGASAVTTFTATLTAGSYKIQANTENGFISISETINVQMPGNTNAATQQMSFNGGTYTLTGSNLSPSSYITVNGFKGNLATLTNSSAVYHVPPQVAANTQSTFSLQNAVRLSNNKFTQISDTSASNVSSAFDGLTNTFYGSNKANCYLGVDAGNGQAVSVHRIRLFPNIQWTNVGKKILHSTIEGSNDMSAWTVLATVDQTIHSGWNVLKSDVTTPFRYVRFHHNSTSMCNIAQFQVYGIFYTTTSLTLSSQSSDVIYNDGLNTQTFSNAIQFRQDKTAVVTSISPKYGNISGGYDITLTGTNLNAGAATVTIDGVDCPVSSSTATTIVCTVGARSGTYTQDNTFTVVLGSSNAILQDTFLYALRWSDQATWGVDIPPVDNDLIVVPKGTTLLVDQDTPILQGIAVDGGTIIFEDGQALTVQAGFITMNGGKFIAGTEQNPHTSPLTFIMHGGYYGSQQPLFGNKGIGCLNCKFSMYGAPRAMTWTTLSATVNVGATTLTLTDAVDWQVGEEIVVASTSFVHEEAERRTITAKSGNTLTVDSAFKFKHVSEVETHGTDLLEMRAEVGLLSRNIKMKGDSSSLNKQYGSHLLLTGQSVNGFEGHVAYTQFMHCGQPQIMGRYCIHFHMAGDVPTSYVRGNAVHDSFARVTTIHGVHYLTVEENVGYKVKGHNFFVEDGIETHNTIRYNLAIGSIQTTRMLQTDTSVASFWITNPTNHNYGNRAAGGDFYGMWYEIKEHPDGTSATMDVCPIGNPLGNVYNNTAHSNKRFGLRIFHLYSRHYPCDPIRNDKHPDDPWQQNPSTESRFYNFTVSKNLEDGVLAEETGHVVFQNFVIAQNYNAGVQFYQANFTKIPPVVKNTVIIGMSNTNAHSNQTNYTNNMSGVITGKSGIYNLSDIRFFNYPAGSLMFQVCRFCDDPKKFTNLGTEVLMEKLTFTNVLGKMLLFIGILKRDVIYDLDGSLSQKFDGTTRSSGTIVQGFPHIKAYNPSTCPPPTTAANWDGAVMCGPTITIRRVMFGNLRKEQLFNNQYIKIAELANINDTTPANATADLFTSEPDTIVPLKQPKTEQKKVWGLPFITGKIYNIWWGIGIDFEHLSIFTSPNFDPADDGIIFKFNYTENRQLFEVGPMVGGGKKLTSLDFINASDTQLDPATCKNGEYFSDNQEGPLRMLTVCQSGKDRAKWQYTDINGIICRYHCPAPVGLFVKESFTRVWSNTSQWPNNTLPQAGQNVTLNGNWTVILDVDPAPLNQFIIDGTLVADDTRNVNITANSIFIRAGNLTAGSPNSPFMHEMTIQVSGNRHDAGIVIDPVIAGNKHFVVTGTLNIHGNAPTTVTTVLTQTATAGSSTIHVKSSTDWAVGDTIALTPSFSASNQYEIHNISAINADGSITLATALAHTHYGASSLTINNHYGTLDTRTRVGHLSRNIKIVPGPDYSWGYTVIIYGFLDGDILRIGNAQVSGVQFDNGGQFESLDAPLVFHNSNSGNYTSSITASSFTYCQAGCLYIKNSHNITFSNNIMYRTYVFGAQITMAKSLTFSNNLITGVTAKPTFPEGRELTACLWVQEEVTLESLTTVKDNYCIGSSTHGFAVPMIRCDMLETNPIANNTAGSTKIGFIINTNNQQCQAFSYAKAFATDIGNICGSPGISMIKFDHFIMADNKRGVTLKHGANEGGHDHSAYLYNSYITAISRPTCAECYGPSATKCTWGQGMRMFTASANGEVLPTKFGSSFDVVCKQPVYDSKSFLENVTFDNFRQTYTGAVSACSNNFVFKPHSGGFDQTGSANLFTSHCTNCDTDSYLNAPAPSPSRLGWFGGCGDILCTGFQNYLVQDHDGMFFGSKGTIVPNNSVIGQAESGCTFSSAMNSYMCSGRQDFGVLEYQSVAADRQTRIMWPVYLFYTGGGYTTVTNGWSEWKWLGNEPMNLRFGRFVSIVTLNQTYNMTFASEPPHKLQLQIQKRTPSGDNNNWLRIKLHYPRPNTIRVLDKNNNVLDPVLLTDVNNTASGVISDLDTSACGTYYYFYTNYTTEFVVTQDPNCLITIELTESVSLTTHFSVPIDQFFSNNNAITNFINNLCALLNIVDTSRVKVIGVHSGSTVVTTSITPSTQNVSDTSVSAISTAATAAINSGSYSAALSGIGIGSVLAATSAYYPLETTEDESSSSIGLIVGIAIACVLLLAGIALTAVCCMRKRAKVVEEIVTHEEEGIQEKTVDKDNFILNGSSENNEIPNDSEFKIKKPHSKNNILHVHHFEDNSEVIDN